MDCPLRFFGSGARAIPSPRATLEDPGADIARPSFVNGTEAQEALESMTAHRHS